MTPSGQATRPTTPTNINWIPRPLKIALGAAGLGISDSRLRPAVRGKTVLITGASSGIGEATARRLARNGATVLLVARRAELLDALCDEIRAAGGRAEAYPCDMADFDAVQRMADRVLAEHGGIDILINSAGKSIRRWVSNSYDRFADYENTTAINYLGPVRLILALMPTMRANGSGHIIQISTTVVDLPPTEWTAYVASKAAFESWLRGAAPEFAVDNVRTTSIHMALVYTPILGPFRMYRYAPGMSPVEAADQVCRAVVTRPRTMKPWMERATAPAMLALESPVGRAMTRYARVADPGNRRGALGHAADRIEALSHRVDDAVARAQSRFGGDNAERPDR